MPLLRRLTNITRFPLECYVLQKISPPELPPPALASSALVQQEPLQQLLSAYQKILEVPENRTQMTRETGVDMPRFPRPVGVSILWDFILARFCSESLPGNNRLKKKEELLSCKLPPGIYIIRRKRGNVTVLPFYSDHLGDIICYSCHVIPRPSTHTHIWMLEGENWPR